jgi:hypothetical protein
MQFMVANPSALSSLFGLFNFSSTHSLALPIPPYFHQPGCLHFSPAALPHWSTFSFLPPPCHVALNI